MEQSPRPNKKKGTVSTSIHGSAPLLWKPHDQLPHTSVSRRPCCDRLYSQTEGENKPFLPRISFVWDFVCGHETSNKDHRNGGSLVAGVRGVLFCCLCGWEAENLKRAWLSLIGPGPQQPTSKETPPSKGSMVSETMPPFWGPVFKCMNLWRISHWVGLPSLFRLWLESGLKETSASLGGRDFDWKQVSK